MLKIGSHVAYKAKQGFNWEIQIFSSFFPPPPSSASVTRATFARTGGWKGEEKGMVERAGGATLDRLRSYGRFFGPVNVKTWAKNEYCLVSSF